MTATWFAPEGTGEVDLSRGEEVESSFGYPSGHRPASLWDQKKYLENNFSLTGSMDADVAERPLPDGMEFYAVLPRWECLARTYGEAVERIFGMLGSQRVIINYREGALGPQNLRQHPRSARMWRTLGRRQKGYEFLVVPVQFGLRHGGRSARWVRRKMPWWTDEFGLGTFEVACLLFMYRERLNSLKCLWIDCPGDEYACGTSRFDDVPYWAHDKSALAFGSRKITEALAYFGSATACLPK